MATDSNLNIVVKVKGNAESQLAKIRQSVGNANKKFQSMKPSLAAIGTAVAAAGAALGGLGVAALREAAKFENLEARFTTLLGNVDAAKERIEEINKMALSTPFQVDELANASALLETFGGAVASTGDGLRFVGDMAAYSQQPVNELALHVGRAMDGLQSGRPFGEAAMRLQELGLVTGASRATLESFAGSTMTADEALQVLKDNVVGVDGSMAMLNNTMTGQWSNVVQQFTAKVRQVGEALAEAFDVKEALRGFADQISQVDITRLVNVIKFMVRVVKAMGNDLRRTFENVRKSLDNEAGRKMVKVLKIVAKILGDVFVVAWKNALTMVQVITLAMVGIFSVWGDDIVAVFEWLGGIIEQWKNAVVSLFEALSAFINGDFSRGLLMLQNFWANVWNGIVSIFEGVVNFILDRLKQLVTFFGGFSGEAKKKIDEFGISFDGARLKTVQYAKTVTTELPKAAKSVEGSGSVMEKALNSVAKGAGGVASATKKLKDKGAGDFEKFVDKSEQAVDKLVDKIKTLGRKLNDLMADHSEEMIENRARLADQVVASEEKVAEMQERKAELVAKIAKESDSERRSELTAELEEITSNINKEIEARGEWSHVIQQIDAEVTEARRQNSLTALGRAVESFLKEREAAQAAFHEKVALMDEELIKLREQKEEALEVVEKNNDEIIKLQKGATAEYKQQLQEQLDETKRQVDAMIAMYEALAQARQMVGVGNSPIGARANGGRVEAGQSYLVGEKGAEIFTPNASGYVLPNDAISAGGTNVNITINGDVSGDEMVQRMVDDIVQQLKLSTAIS